MPEPAVAVLDDKMWKQFMKRIETNVANPTKILATAYGTIGYRDIINHFSQERGPSGPWKELSPARLRQRGNNAKILQDTGNLRNSITPTNYRNEGQAIRVFAAAPYGGVHDRGGRNMPQRAFMWLSKEALSNMAKMILQLLTK